MIVGACFVGDENKLLMRVQSDSYGVRLWDMFNIARNEVLWHKDKTRFEWSLLGKLPKIDRFDHRVLQSSHDKIAAYFRYWLGTPRPPLFQSQPDKYRKFLGEIWHTFFVEEIADLCGNIDCAYDIVTAVVYENTEQGYKAEARLVESLNTRYSNVEWIFAQGQQHDTKLSIPANPLFVMTALQDDGRGHLEPPVEKAADLASAPVEILPQLTELYGGSLRSNITSVKVGCDPDRCFLEVKTDEFLGDSLHDELIRRTDLGFIEEEDKVPFFNPGAGAVENARKFIQEFDPVGIANCIDLFTDEAARNFISAEDAAVPIEEQLTAPSLSAQAIDLTEVAELGYRVTDMMEEGDTPPVYATGHCYAFYFEPLSAAAKARGIGWHTALLQRSIAGLFAQKSQQHVLVGYQVYPQMIRVFVLARRPPSWQKFSKAIAGPGFMEEGDDAVRIDTLRALAYWEPPNSAVALWPTGAEGETFGIRVVDTGNLMAYFSEEVDEDLLPTLDPNDYAPVPIEPASTFVWNKKQISYANRFFTLQVGSREPQVTLS